MMNFELSSLLLIAGLYLSCIFGLAYITEKGWLPSSLVNHPLIYVLSLGVCISTWSFYSSVMATSTRGYGYTAYYIGYASAFLLAPIFLQPILRITRTYQLSSMADLFAFRFSSPWAGTLTALILLLCSLSLIAIQLSVLTSSIVVIFPNANTHLLAFCFCGLMALFTNMFGSRDISGRDKHRGLVMAMAFEALFKLLIFCGLGLYAIFAVFGGLDTLDSWLLTQPTQIELLDIPLLQNPSNLVILLFFTAAITMPHMFQMVFKENTNPSNLRFARWCFPILLLLISLPVLPILWAAEYLNSDVSAQFSALAIGMLNGSNFVVYCVFLGGMAGCFGISVVLSMAMSNMCTKHILLPLKKPETGKDIYHWLAIRRQFFIGIILLASFLTYLITSTNASMTNVSYVSFIACAQFLPGILALLYWPNANKNGFIAGLIAGVFTWSVLGLIPLLFDITITQLSFSSPNVFNWNLVTSLSLLTNLVVLISISIFTTTSEEELAAGNLCSRDSLRRTIPINLLPKAPIDFIELLTPPLGKESAKREVNRALNDLSLDKNDSKPSSIHLLREQIEANLSGLLGPTAAQQIFDHSLPFESMAHESSLNVGYLEKYLEISPNNLSGLAQDLDSLRRHHRQILKDLPTGVCSLNSNLEISLWNSAMETLTGISDDSIIGALLSSIEQPWQDLLTNFINDTQITHVPKKAILIKEKTLWVSLHKANIENAPKQNLNHDELVIVIEDLTETELLESELAHSERLASIGRLAAGVAHEIGNPITGIACLAQNIRDESEDRELKIMAEQIIEQTKRTSSIVQSLVNFSHKGAITSESEFSKNVNDLISIHLCVTQAIQLISLDHESKNIVFVNDCSVESKMRGDQQLLQQILLNLLSNARDASQDGSKVYVTNSINGDELSIIVSDSGDGIPEPYLEQVFEPFFTTKEPGKGTGLGLSLVYNITQNLGGTIKIISPTDKVGKTGTRVIVTFPCYDERST